MRKVLIISQLGCLLLVFTPVFGANELPGLIAGIQKKYGAFPGFSIPYTREVITRSMSMLGNQIRGDVAAGHIFFMPPYFLKLKQETPARELIVGDGSTLWWYIPGKKQAYRYSFEKFGKELRLLTDVFRGLSGAEKRFRISLIGRDEKSGQYRIELRPDPPWEEIDCLLLTVDPEHAIHVVEIHNTLGSITRFILGKMKVQEHFAADFFRFVPPEGVQIIEED